MVFRDEGQVPLQKRLGSLHHKPSALRSCTVGFLMWKGAFAVLDVAFYATIAALGLAAAAVTLFHAAGGAGGPRKIRVGLNWLPETEHCGFFQAEAAGLYRKAGLDVEIESGGPDINLPLMVGSGRVDLGMGTSFTTLNMVSAGVDAETVAAFFQKDPQTLVAHGGRGVSKFEDLKRRPIMIGNFARQEFWLFLKQKYGFTDDQIRPYNYSPAAFLADSDAVAQGYVTQDGLLLGSQMRQPMVSFLLADYGFDNYSQTLFGMRRWIDGHQDDVRRLVLATAEGYRECVNGPAPDAMKLVLARNPEHGEPLYLFKRRKMLELGMVTGGDAARLGVGAMTHARWKRFFETMVAAGLYPQSLDYRRAYTLEFSNPGAL